MGAAVLIFFLLPWLDRSPVRSIRYKGPYYKTALALFVVSFLVLGWLGTQPTDFLGKLGGTDTAVILARLFTVVVLRVLPAHALVQPHRPHQARARARDRVGGREPSETTTMKKILFVLLALPLAAHAAGGHTELDPAPIDTRDVVSIQRGARVFVNYCLNCHSAQYMRYNRLHGARAERAADPRQPHVRCRASWATP